MTNRYRQPANAIPGGPEGQRVPVLALMDGPATRTQKEAAAYLSVSARYLRDSSCPKILLPGTGAAGRPIVRYDPTAVREWRDAHRSDRRAA